MPDDATPDAVDAVIRRLGQDPERDLDVLAVARRRWPDDEALACIEARALHAAGHPAAAEQALRAFLAAQPDAQAAVEALAETLLESDEHAALAELLDELGEPQSPMVLRYRARSARRQGDADACADALAALLDLAPGDRATAALLARVERERGNWGRALELLDGLVDRGEPGELDWERVVAASVVGDWARARASARRLGFELDGDGPIDEAWEPCLVHITSEHESTTLLAQRTGPVTARVLQMAGPGKRERFRDVVVFDPAPLNPPGPGGDGDAGGEGGGEAIQRQPLLVFSAVHVLERGQMTCYSLDGVHPGDDAVEAISRGVEALGGVLSVRSDIGYRLAVRGGARDHDHSASGGHASARGGDGPESSGEGAAGGGDGAAGGDDGAAAGDTVLGLYAFAAVPEGTRAADLHARLSELTRGLEHPLVWLELAEALGDEAEIARQRAIAARYGL